MKFNAEGSDIHHWAQQMLHDFNALLVEWEVGDDALKVPRRAPVGTAAPWEHHLQQMKFLDYPEYASISINTVAHSTPKFVAKAEDIETIRRYYQDKARNFLKQKKELLERCV